MTSPHVVAEEIHWDARPAPVQLVYVACSFHTLSHGDVAVFSDEQEAEAWLDKELSKAPPRGLDWYEVEGHDDSQYIVRCIIDEASGSGALMFPRVTKSANKS